MFALKYVLYCIEQTMLQLRLTIALYEQTKAKQGIAVLKLIPGSLKHMFHDMPWRYAMLIYPGMAKSYRPTYKEIYAWSLEK